MALISRNSLKRFMLIHNLGRPSYLIVSRSFCSLPDRDKPVTFTTSEAASWRAEYSRRGNIYDDSPEAQPYVVSLSTAIFLYYFLIYREESDIDEALTFSEESLYSKVDGLEEVQLSLLRQRLLDNGLDTQQVDVRLRQLEQERLHKL